MRGGVIFSGQTLSIDLELAELLVRFGSLIRKIFFHSAIFFILQSLLIYEAKEPLGSLFRIRKDLVIQDNLKIGPLSDDANEFFPRIRLAI